MILNMHIRNDYQMWLETPKKRVTTLCGKITATKYAGIPYITQNQPLVVFKRDDGTVDCAWCLKCCASLLEDVDNSDFYWAYLRNAWLKGLYTGAIDVCATQIAMATSPQ